MKRFLSVTVAAHQAQFELGIRNIFVDYDPPLEEPVFLPSVPPQVLQAEGS